jgi:glyoxylase-like metal-dependent hydrolase (beta-lactamase superfamily II)
VRVGGLQTNCYILSPDGSKDCVIIDPGGDPQRIIEAVHSAGLRPRYILCTHGHADHTGAAALVHEAFEAEFYLHSADVAYSIGPPQWLVMALGGFETPPDPDEELEGESSLPLGDGVVELIRTPGHTPGSTCFKFEDMLFTGDTLFRESIGRYDLPGGDGEQELASIRDRLLTLDDATRVFPGHGPSSTIGYERRNNPFLR